MKRELKVVKHQDGWIEFRVNGGHVMFLEKGISFEEARLKAYEYIWDHPQYMWDIVGKVA